LLEAECAVVPTAKSQVRAIASLNAYQQVEIWQQACRESKGVPTAIKVREIKAVMLDEAPPIKLLKPPVTPEPEILLSRLKERLKSTKVSLKDIEVLLELIQELRYSNQ
jgi:hypothetical protein